MSNHKYTIDLTSFNSLTFNGKGWLGNNADSYRGVKIHKTFAFGPELSFYDMTNKRWINKDEIERIIYHRTTQYANTS